MSLMEEVKLLSQTASTLAPSGYNSLSYTEYHNKIVTITGNILVITIAS